MGTKIQLPAMSETVEAIMKGMWREEQKHYLGGVHDEELSDAVNEMSPDDDEWDIDLIQSISEADKGYAYPSLFYLFIKLRLGITNEKSLQALDR